MNKSIFTAPSFRNCQLTFVAFHFAITYGTLYIASRPFLGGGMFAPSRSNSSGASSPWTLLPLTVAMAGNVVFMNLSLAHSSVIFYQIVRILLTPLTALLNLFIYRAVIPWGAVLALAPACIGVGIVSFIEATAQSPSSRPLQSTSVLGVVFAFTGVAVSALYTVWVAAYHRSLNLSSVQLLYKQMPLGGLMLLVVGYFTDTYPVWSEVTTRLWGMLILVRRQHCWGPCKTTFAISTPSLALYSPIPTPFFWIDGPWPASRRVPLAHNHHLRAASVQCRSTCPSSTSSRMQDP